MKRKKKKRVRNAHPGPKYDPVPESAMEGLMQLLCKTGGEWMDFRSLNQQRNDFIIGIE